MNSSMSSLAVSGPAAPSPSSGVPWQQRVHSVAPLPDKLTHLLKRQPWLENPLLSASVITLGVLLLAAWALRARWECRHDRPVAHRLMRRVALAAASFLLLATGSGLAVNSYVGYVPSLSALHPTVGTTVDVPTGVPAGDIADQVRQHLSVSGAGLRARVVLLRVPVGGQHGGRRPVEVYLPAGYLDPRNAGRHYPVAYLLHGYPGRAVDWLDGGGLLGTADTLTQQGLIPPMIIAMPQVARSPFTDSECLNLPGGEQDETFLTDTLPRAVDTTFRTQPARTGRAIGGMSSGAYCALNLALHHPDVFSVSMSIEPFGDPGANLQKALGMRIWRANSPRLFLPGRHLTQPQAFYLGAGSHDPETKRNASSLSGLLAKAGAEVGVYIDPGGGHTWREAARQLPYALIFAARHFS